MDRTDSSPVLASPAPVLLQAAKPRLILASASPVRFSLLQAAGIDVLVRPSHVDEDAIKRAARRRGAGPDEVALLLAECKARGVPEPGALVIGADQLLVCDGDWFDKPVDRQAARTHLLALRGRPHVLHTAIVLVRDGERVWQHIARPHLVMRAFSDALLDAYLGLEGDHVLGCVGAYRLEGPGLQLFGTVEGEHAAILGLPMLALLGFLRECGVLLA